MAKIKRFTSKDGGYHGELGFYCPGCDCVHFIYDKESNAPSMPVWGFNGNFESPTVTPSVLVQNKTMRCHSFITDGNIQFLPDCTHDLAGKTIELEDID
ncbi:MAG: hypothetical protein H6Q17_577 [Bacteroidetes bacterium]|nr:hypothetical protein [Bacteroidota bacterium]